MSRMNASDREVTPEMAQRVIDVVETREGPDFPGWSRTNSALTRAAAWEILSRPECLARDRGSEFVAAMIALNIRREFEVDGQKSALKKPYGRQKTKQETWRRKPCIELDSAETGGEA